MITWLPFSWLDKIYITGQNYTLTDTNKNTHKQKPTHTHTNYRTQEQIKIYHSERHTYTM